MHELKRIIEKHPLKDPDEEIEFFKDSKPKFYSQFIYYVKVFHIEIYRPTAESHLMGIMYFVRRQQDVRVLPDDLILSIDHSFSTIQSYKVSKLFTYELLRIYLNTAISSLQMREGSEASKMEKRLQWTGSKVSLIELIYSLQSVGVVNNGSADIKMLTAFFERTFQVELGNAYNVFQEMRLRKRREVVF